MHSARAVEYGNPSPRPVELILWASTLCLSGSCGFLVSDVPWVVKSLSCLVYASISHFSLLSISVQVHIFNDDQDPVSDARLPLTRVRGYCKWPWLAAGAALSPPGDSREWRKEIALRTCGGHCFSHPLCSNYCLRVGEKSHLNCTEGNQLSTLAQQQFDHIHFAKATHCVKVTELSAEESLPRNV